VPFRVGLAPSCVHPQPIEFSSDHQSHRAEASTLTSGWPQRKYPPPFLVDLAGHQ
jgi:hypothetical protein